MAIKWIEYLKCPHCGCMDWVQAGMGQFPILYDDGVYGGAPLRLITYYRECMGCGLIRQDPRMNDASLEEYYVDGHYRESINETPELQDKFERNRYERVNKMLPTYKPGMHLLDVGCSHGYLLDLAPYDEVLGVEPNANYVTTQKPTVRSIAEVTGLWNVITCLHVLEHIPEPWAMAERLCDLLAPGGWLFIETPSNERHGYSPYRLPHIFHIPAHLVRKWFVSLQLSYFEKEPHYLHVFRKAAA